MFVAMIPVGVLNVIPHLMATDTLDYWEDKTGDRCEGITFSLMSLRSKVSSGLKDYCLSYLLVFFGFSQILPFLSDHKPVQSDFTKFGLFAIYTIIPAVLNLVSIIPILFYKLSGKKMAEIQNRLAAKRLEDARRLESIATTEGEKGIYSLVAEKELESEIQEHIDSIAEKEAASEAVEQAKNEEVVLEVAPEVKKPAKPRKTSAKSKAVKEAKESEKEDI